MGERGNIMDDKKIVGERLRDLRIKSNLTLEEVGNKIGRTKRQVKSYEDGTTSISLVMLKKITEEVYGIKVGTFLNDIF